MNKVVTIELNGAAYHVHEDGYSALRRYLDRAEAQLGSNTERREVLADLEQSIAGKFTALLRPHKTVITGDEVRQILTEIGPVQNADGEQVNIESPSSSQDAAPREPMRSRSTRRLYRIREGAVFSGLCNGLAAYADLNVYMVRAFWALGAIFTGGGLALLYVIMVFIVPVAYTEDEVAAAHAAPATRR